MPRAEWDLVSAAPVPCPRSPEKQAQAAALLNAAIGSVQVELERLQHLRMQKHALMQRLFNGERHLNKVFGADASTPEAVGRSHRSNGTATPPRVNVNDTIS